MTDERDSGKQELRRLMRMLNGISKTARDASLTGQLAGGKAVAVRQYNAILARLRALELVSGDLFTPLAEDAAFDEVGVAASQLTQFLRDDDEDDRRRRFGNHGVFEASPNHVKIVGFPGQISELGDLVREYLPDLIKDRLGRGFRDPVKKESRPEEEAQSAASADPLEQRLADARREMQQIAEWMARPDVPPDQMRSMAEDLSRLALRQAELAREKAGREESAPR